MSQSSFSDISPGMLRRMAGDRSFGRGEEYFKTGAVATLAIDGDRASASVIGTRKYKVHFKSTGSGIDATCTCPAYEDSGFCKHCVAVGLAIMQATRNSQNAGDNAGEFDEDITMDKIRNHLKTLGEDELVEIIIDQAIDDERLMRNLRMKAETSGEGGASLGVLKGFIDEAVDTCGFIGYNESWDYARQISEVTEEIEELLEQGEADKVMELTEYFITELEDVLQEIDDSDGCVGDTLRDLEALHLEATLEAKPEPVALARRLFELETNSEWDSFYNAVETYAPVLKKKGQAEYRRLAETEWNDIAPVKAGEMEKRFDSNRRRITSIMESLAKSEGDVEALVSVKARDLTSDYAYLEIARIYDEDGNHEKALEWALAGIEAFKDQPLSARLLTSAAEQYQHLNRPEEAVNMVWKVYSQRPDLDNYKILKKHADKTKKWSPWREKALAHIRDKIKAAKQKKKSDNWYYSYHNDHSVLVDIFMWEKDPDAAWSEAQKGGCTLNLWLKLAAAREKTHPQDAINVYQQMIAPIVSRTNNDAYKDATKLIKKIDELMKNQGNEDQFTAYLDQVRATHKRKRNFMKLLDKMK